MNFYIVMQGRTYEMEQANEMICSEIFNKKGETPHFWSRMKEVVSGDFIFHYVKGEIVAVSITRSNCYEGFVPYEDKEEERYIVKTTYFPLERPLAIKPNIDKIAPLLPVKYSAFQENGDGIQGYLFPCNELLAIKLLELISDLNIYFDPIEQLEFAMGPIVTKERNELVPVLSTAEAEANAKIRRSYKHFERAVHEKWHGQCAICGLDVPELLHATYAKPWKDCSVVEMIDPMNGLLLCFNHEALYKKGFISFDGTGRIHLSPQLSPEHFEQLGLHPKLKVRREEQNKPYYKWHKKYIFKK